MDIGSDDASNDVVECSDGKEATGSDKEIKGHLVDNIHTLHLYINIANNIYLKELKLRIILPPTWKVPKILMLPMGKNQRILRPAAVTRDL